MGIHFPGVSARWFKASDISKNAGGETCPGSGLGRYGWCDVVVINDSVPLEHQRIFWGAELVEDTVLGDRLTEVVGRTIEHFSSTSPEGPLPNDAPLYNCGPPMIREPAIGLRVAENLGRWRGKLHNLLYSPEDFPRHDLVVNMGLILREA